MKPIDKTLNHIPFGVAGVYKLTAPNGKIYIGQSINIRKRLNAHKNDSIINPKKTCISRAIKKYGFENFKIDALIYFKLHKDTSFNTSLLDSIEIACINRYKALDKKFGYNIKLGGSGGGGHSEATKEKLRQKAIGRKLSDETKAKIKASHGRTPESYVAHSKKMKGRTQSREVIDKVVNSNLYRYKAVDQYTIDGTFIQSFRSAEYAANSINSASWRILKAVRKNKILDGFVWRFKGEDFNQPNLSKCRLNQYDTDMKLIYSHKNKSQASKLLGFDASHLSKASSGKRELAYGFIWKEFICQL